MHTFFPRGNGPLISVLIPTRGRPAHLCRAVDSCWSLAKDKSLIEFIFKIDDDDTETISTVEKIEKITPCKKIISPRNRGYWEMDRWVNEMSGLADGDWLFLFNDDALIKTEAWDQLILFIGTSKPWSGFTKCCLLMCPTIGRPFAQEFIMLRRDTFKMLGHFSLSPHNDNWIYSLMNFVGAVLWTQIEIDHLSDRIGDKTREESVEAYKTTISTIKSVEAKKLKMIDAQKLVDYMADSEQRREWVRKPVNGDGWYWYHPPGEEITHMYVHGDKGVFIFDSKVSPVFLIKDKPGVFCPME